MPFTINEGLKGGDPDLFVALAVIGLVRNGKVERDNAMDVAEILLGRARMTGPRSSW